MKESYIVSLNIIKNTYKNQELINKELINPDKYPILFYSNKTISFKEELVNNQELYGLLSGLNVFDYLNYANISINGIKYNISNQEYSEENIEVQDIFKLSDIEEGRDIANSIIYLLCSKMYSRAQGDPNELSENVEENIKTICKYLGDTYPNDYSENDLKTFIKTKLTNITRLTNDNIEFVYNQFCSII